MGRGSLSKPERLTEKLLAIRNSQNLSQNGLIRFLDLTDELTQAEISAFERGVRIPSLLVLLRYARKFNLNVEILIDDDLNLP
jgi:transcriptional regulator with XRE-family HTH domain